MIEVKIYGHSDDIIGVNVNGEGYDEFVVYDLDDDARILCSDGTALSVRYDNDGIWRFTLVHRGSAEYSKHEATNDETDYSDIVTLKGDIRWVALGKSTSIKAAVQP